MLPILSFVFMFDLDDGSDYWEYGMAESILQALADNRKKSIFSSIFFISASLFSINNTIIIKAHRWYWQH